MKGGFFKLLPLLAGAALGWLLLASPAWFAALGPARFLVAAALVGALLVGVVALQIEAALPADAAIDPLPDPEPRELADRVAAYEALGFVRAGPTCRIGINPPAVLVPLVHETARTYGSVFRTGTIPARVSNDMFSVLSDGRARLTTSPDPGGGTLPAPAGAFRQVIPGAAPAELLDRHRAALGYLARHGLPARPVSGAAFASDYRGAITMLRAAFHRAPLRFATTALLRVAIKRPAAIGPLEGQRDVAARIAAVTRGAGPGA
jgi:hypothetical protein